MTIFSRCGTTWNAEAIVAFALSTSFYISNIVVMSCRSRATVTVICITNYSRNSNTNNISAKQTKLIFTSNRANNLRNNAYNNNIDVSNANSERASKRARDDADDWSTVLLVNGMEYFKNKFDGREVFFYMKKMPNKLYSSWYSIHRRRRCCRRRCCRRHLVKLLKHMDFDIGTNGEGAYK